MSNYAIEVHTVEDRGDHGADIVIALRPIKGETVEQLMERFDRHAKKHLHVSYLVLRVTVEEVK